MSGIIYPEDTSYPDRIYTYIQKFYEYPTLSSSFRMPFEYQPYFNKTYGPDILAHQCTFYYGLYRQSDILFIQKIFPIV